MPISERTAINSQLGETYLCSYTKSSDSNVLWNSRVNIYAVFYRFFNI